jgi:hypothetical protein
MLRAAAARCRGRRRVARRLAAPERSWAVRVPGAAGAAVAGVLRRHRDGRSRCSSSRVSRCARGRRWAGPGAAAVATRCRVRVRHFALALEATPPMPDRALRFTRDAGRGVPPVRAGLARAALASAPRARRARFAARRSRSCGPGRATCTIRRRTSCERFPRRVPTGSCPTRATARPADHRHARGIDGHMASDATFTVLPEGDGELPTRRRSTLPNTMFATIDSRRGLRRRPSPTSPPSPDYVVLVHRDTREFGVGSSTRSALRRQAEWIGAALPPGRHVRRRRSTRATCSGRNSRAY